jgi:hypothetical protein
MSSTGTGTACTLAQPCASLVDAISSLIGNSGRIVCRDAILSGPENIVFVLPSIDLEMDCPQGVEMLSSQFGLSGAGARTMKFRNMTFVGVPGGFGSLSMTQSGGTVLLENCIFDGLTTRPAIDIEPASALNLVIKNSRISNSGSGLLLKPQPGGSIKATLDHVTITGNIGGGVKIDTTNGPVTADVTDSEISNNAGNGLNAISGTSGGLAIFNVSRSVIANNGAAGIQANGVNAGVLVATTLLDQNAAGATSVVGGGNIFTYGNNQIVGSAGSGFNHTGGLQ